MTSSFVKFAVDRYDFARTNPILEFRTCYDVIGGTQEENRDMKTQLERVTEREARASREVERLRAHLLTVEEGYTRELLDAEEREKDLRTRLAGAEERAVTASSSVDRAK